ncbi:MAG: hypothetical protein ACRDLN_03140 [Solirubrobacteraceae bacterium]
MSIFLGDEATAEDLRARLTPAPRLIPAGFDAIAQFDLSLLEAQLRRNMMREGLLVLDANLPYDRETVPSALRAAVEPRFQPLQSLADPFIEMRLTDPRLVTLRSDLGSFDVASLPVEDMVATTGDAAPTDDAAPSERSLGVVETTWTLELNLLLRTEGDIIVMGATTGSPPIDVVVADRAAIGRARVRESRETLGRGSARIPATTVRVRRTDRGHFWIRIDVGALEPQFEADDQLMRAVLASDLGRTLLAAVLAPLVAEPDLRLTPRLALAGKSDALPGPALQFRALVLRHRDGRELLSLCVDAGVGSRGSPELVQSFLGEQNFAYYVSTPVAKRVVSTRWRSTPGLRTIVSEVPVELAESEDSEQTQEGLARIRVHLADSVSTVDIRPSESDVGDALRMVSEQQIRLLNVWDHRGEEITDLGELKEPVTLPFVWLIFLFDRDPTPQVTSPGKTTLLRLAGEVAGPLFRPLVEDLTMRRVEGYASSALGALFVRADLRQPQLGPPPTGPEHEAEPQLPVEG